MNIRKPLSSLQQGNTIVTTYIPKLGNTILQSGRSKITCDYCWFTIYMCVYIYIYGQVKVWLKWPTYHSETWAGCVTSGPLVWPFASCCWNLANSGGALLCSAGLANLQHLNLAASRSSWRSRGLAHLHLWRACVWVRPFCSSFSINRLWPPCLRSIFFIATATATVWRSQRRQRARARLQWHLYRVGLVPLSAAQLRRLVLTLGTHHSRDHQFISVLKKAMKQSNQPWRCVHCRQLRKHSATHCTLCKVPWQSAMDRTYVHGVKRNSTSASSAPAPSGMYAQQVPYYQTWQGFPTGGNAQTNKSPRQTTQSPKGNVPIRAVAIRCVEKEMAKGKNSRSWCLSQRSHILLFLIKVNLLDILWAWPCPLGHQCRRIRHHGCIRELLWWTWDHCHHQALRLQRGPAQCSHPPVQPLTPHCRRSAVDVAQPTAIFSSAWHIGPFRRLGLPDATSQRPLETIGQKSLWSCGSSERQSLWSARVSSPCADGIAGAWHSGQWPSHRCAEATWWMSWLHVLWKTLRISWRLWSSYVPSPWTCSPCMETFWYVSMWMLPARIPQLWSFESTSHSCGFLPS